MFAAVARYLGNIAGTAGTLLILDDLQWAGSDACDLLAALARSPTTAPLRLIGGYRNTRGARWRRACRRHSPASNMKGCSINRRSARLTEEESATFLRQLLPNGDADRRRDPGARATAMRRDSVLPRRLGAGARKREHCQRAKTRRCPWDVMQSIRRRIATQSEVAGEVMQTLAVAGGKASLRLLRDVLLASGRSEDDVVAALESSARARLLDETSDDAYQFASNVIRDVVARDLSAARRTALHRRIAAALEHEPGEIAG